MRKIFLILLVLAVPAFASAHTRWFSDGELTPLQTTEPTFFYLSVLAIIALLITCTATFLHQHNILRLGFLRSHKPHIYERAASTFTMITGAFLLIAGTHEYLFSPNLTLEAGIPNFLIIIQIIIGLSFMLGIFTRLSAILLGIVWATSFCYVGWILMIENIWILSTAAFITIMGNDYFSMISFSLLRNKFEWCKEYALSLLRLGTGVTLMILGLSEKITAPELGINFLAQHHWNFIQALGFNFSDYLFTLTAGSVEMLFGLIFVMGVVTRTNALVVAVIFTIPLFILGPIELSGHLPHFAAVILLLMFGNGGHFILCKTYEDAKVNQ